jgi:acyl-CoA thioesterase YciA
LIGKLLSWLDDAGVAYAMEVCDTPRVVTIKIGDCLLKKAAKEGQLLKIYGRVYEFGNTSLTLLLECISHNVYTGKQSTVLTTKIKFVWIDENGDPIPISKIVKNMNIK